MSRSSTTDFAQQVVRTRTVSAPALRVKKAVDHLGCGTHDVMVVAGATGGSDMERIQQLAREILRDCDWLSEDAVATARSSIRRCATQIEELLTDDDEQSWSGRPPLA